MKYPLSLGTSLPDELAVITSANIDQLETLTIIDLGNAQLAIPVMRFSQDGRYIVTGIAREAWIVVDVLAHKVVARGKTPIREPYLEYLSLSGDNTLVYSTYHNSRSPLVGTLPIVAQHVSSGEIAAEYGDGYPAYRFGFSSFEISPNDHYLAVSLFSQPGSVHLWDLQKDRRIGPIAYTDGPLPSYDFSTDSQYLAVGTRYLGKTITLWKLGTFTFWKNIPAEGFVKDILFSADGQTLFYLSGVDNKTCWLVKLKLETQESIKSKDSLACNEFYYVYLSTGVGTDLLLRGYTAFYESEGLLQKAFFDLPDSDIKAVAISPDGRLIAAQKTSLIYLMGIKP